MDKFFENWKYFAKIRICKKSLFLSVKSDFLCICQSKVSIYFFMFRVKTYFFQKSFNEKKSHLEVLLNLDFQQESEFLIQNRDFLQLESFYLVL